MVVAEPWIDASPAPLTCQALGGLPAFAFSHATGFAHAARPEAEYTPSATRASARPSSARRAREWFLDGVMAASGSRAARGGQAVRQCSPRRGAAASPKGRGR